QDVICMVNTQQNCASQKCSLTGVCNLTQECEISGLTIPALVHASTEDYVLNLTHMHDA
ncbi:hypothetical protein JB92DRAFT_2609841, partial [Gautieria morchelliformis]